MTSYDWDASEYEKHSSVQQAWARELITKLDLKGNERVLDIGCGDGKVTAELASHVPDGEVIGIDNSASMIAQATEQYSLADFANLRFMQSDARSLSFHDAFDVVFSNAVLHWVTDHLSVLRGIHTSLRVGGRILMQMGGKGNAVDVVAVMDEMRTSPRWAAYFQDFTFPYWFYGTDDYRGWLAEVGLTPTRIELLPKDMSHSNGDGLKGWIRTTWLPYTERIVSEKREDFIDDFAARYLTRCPADADGRTHVQMIRLEVEARKDG